MMSIQQKSTTRLTWIWVSCTAIIKNSKRPFVRSPMAISSPTPSQNLGYWVNPLVIAFLDIILAKLNKTRGVCALVIAFNRFHNYVVAELAVINEGGRFSLPIGMKPTDKGYEDAELRRDNDLFQTGRL